MRLASVAILRDGCDIVEAFVRPDATLRDRRPMRDNPGRQVGHGAPA